VNGRYSTTDYNASFVGFLPSRNPVVAIIVVTDSPRVYPNTGGWVSAPVFKRIAEATLQYLGVPPTINPAPPVLIARNPEGSPEQTAGPDPTEPVVSLVADGPAGTVPDVRGLSAREAVRKLVRIGLNARVSGNGFVVSQQPEPGSPLEDGGLCTLVLSRAGGEIAQGSARP
jgi:cell division protein FtsI (penicillin-binding protein 3)